jgi:hypothetical protein
MTEYQGHESWNAWNVALWIANNSDLYYPAVRALRATRTVREATEVWFKETGLRNMKTADGAKYTARSVGLALYGLEIEQRSN